MKVFLKTHLKCNVLMNLFISKLNYGFLCAVLVLMCHTVSALHRIEMYWMHAECCVAFLSVSQHGDESSHWQQNQSSLSGAASCWAGRPLSPPLTPQTLRSPGPRRTCLCSGLPLSKFSWNRHTFITSRFIFQDSQHVFALLLSFPEMEKSNTDFLSRWKWELDIVSYRQHLFAGDRLVHWYVWAISSSV